MYPNKLNKFVILITLTTISGCASNPGELRSFYPLSSPVEDLSQHIDKITHKIRGATLDEVCINKAKDDGASTSVCKESVLYETHTESAGVGAVATLGNAFDNCSTNDPRCELDRNNFIDLATRIADTNCNEFRERIFAKRAGANIITGVIRDSMNVGGAATAFSSPATSAGMSLGGLLVGSYDKTNQELFSNKTAQVFDKAIEQSMKAFYKDTLVDECKKSHYGECSVNRAANLIKQYTSLCSVRAALLTIEQALKTENVSAAAVEAVKKAASTAAEAKAGEVVNISLDSKISSAVNSKVSSLTSDASTAKTDAAAAKSDATTAKSDAAAAMQKITQTTEAIKTLCRALKQSSDAGLKASLTDTCN